LVCMGLLSGDENGYVSAGKARVRFAAHWPEFIAARYTCKLLYLLDLPNISRPKSFHGLNTRTLY
jgi:hypothetical protein